MHIGFFNQNGLVLDYLMPVVPRSVADSSAHLHRVRWGRLFAGINLNCWSMVSFRIWTVHHITIVMCKICCNVGAERCCHNVPTFQILPHVITGCWHIWKNFCGEKDLKQMMVSAPLSMPLYAVPARFTQLQLIIYHVDGKSVWTVPWIILSNP